MKEVQSVENMYEGVTLACFYMSCGFIKLMSNDLRQSYEYF